MITQSAIVLNELFRSTFYLERGIGFDIVEGSQKMKIIDFQTTYRDDGTMSQYAQHLTILDIKPVNSHI